MIDLLNIIKEAANTGEIITIIYAGGTRPGMPREITVTTAGLRDFTARDIGGEVSKQFKYEKLIEATNSLTTAKNPSAPKADKAPLPQYATLSEYSDLLLRELETQGWHIVHSPQSIELYELLKNGKRKINPTIHIRWIDVPLESQEWDWLKEEYVTVTQNPNQIKPWLVTSKHKAVGRAFKHLHAAVQFFYSEASENAPSKQIK